MHDSIKLHTTTTLQYVVQWSVIHFARPKNAQCMTSSFFPDAIAGLAPLSIYVCAPTMFLSSRFVERERGTHSSSIYVLYADCEKWNSLQPRWKVVFLEATISIPEKGFDVYTASDYYYFFFFFNYTQIHCRRFSAACISFFRKYMHILCRIEEKNHFRADVNNAHDKRKQTFIDRQT